MLLTLLTLFILSSGTFAQSCQGRCDDPFDPNETCQCNTACSSHNDCCSDYGEICLGNSNSCKGRCDDGYDPSLACQCNTQCSSHHNCCPDYNQECQGQGGLTDQDLLELGDLLLSLDKDNVWGQYQLNLQCKTSVGNPKDCSPEPLFTFVDPAVLEIPVFKKLSALYDNYHKNSETHEDHTEQEQEEEMDFLDEVLRSSVMNTTYHYLLDRGAFHGSWSEWASYCYDLWFGMYNRPQSSHALGSSGFEHVFIGEVKVHENEVSGFHNWFHLYTLEKSGNINYLGHWKHVTFEAGGEGLSFTFTWDGAQKDYGSAFIGTSPSLEMALYTTCYLTRLEVDCRLALGGQDVYITTWDWKQGDDHFVGSSYPDWEK